MKNIPGVHTPQSPRMGMLYVEKYNVNEDIPVDRRQDYENEECKVHVCRTFILLCYVAYLPIYIIGAVGTRP